MKRLIAHSKTNTDHTRRGDGLHGEVLRGNERALIKSRYDSGVHAPDAQVLNYYNPQNGTLIKSWGEIPSLTEDQLDADVGYLQRDSASDTD